MCSSDLIAGPQEQFTVVPFLEEGATSYGDAVANAIAAAAENPEGVVVFCDLMGGTPFNQSMIAAATLSNVDVIAGCNLPMLLESCSERVFDASRSEVVDVALAAGTMGVVRKELEVELLADDVTVDESGT